MNNLTAKAQRAVSALGPPGDGESRPSPLLLTDSNTNLLTKRLAEGREARLL
jgi:hypothetical protein